MASLTHYFFLFSLLITTAIARNIDAEDCRLEHLAVTLPSRKLQFDGGFTELWDESSDDFRCAGVAATRNTIKPRGLAVPNYEPYPTLIFIHQGRALLGTVQPGCPETYQTRTEEPTKIDEHQKVQRIKAGDVVLIPAGVIHFCYNDGQKDLVAISVSDLLNPSNQLDRTQRRAFYLAGGVTRKQKKSGADSDEEAFRNIFNEMDEEESAESFNISIELMRKIRKSNERGLIVKVRKGSMGYIQAEEEQLLDGTRQSDGGFRGSDQFACNLNNKQNIGDRSDPLIFSSNAGRLTFASQQTLPALQGSDMSASRLELLPNAISSPQFIASGHTVVYVTQGEARVQVIGSSGKRFMNQTVRLGDMFVIPQWFVASLKAGENGFEAVNFRTSSSPSISALMGKGSVFAGLPVQVIANSYKISEKEAEMVKQGRRYESVLLSPGKSRAFS